MESKVYQEEMKGLLIREIPPDEAVEIAGWLYRDERVKDLLEKIGHPLDECVRVFVGMTGCENVDTDDFLTFLGTVYTLGLEVAMDQDLRKRYQELQPVDRATAILDLWEISSLILVAVMSGLASGTAATLVRSFFGGNEKQKRVDLMAKFLLDSPIPALLASCPDGLSVEDIAAGSNLPETAVGIHLGRLQERQWVKKKERDGKVFWRLRKRKLLKDFKE